MTTRGVDPAALRLPRRIGARLPAFLAPPAASAITVCAALRPTRLLPRLVTANGVSQSRSALRAPPPAASFDPSNSVCLASSCVHTASATPRHRQRRLPVPFCAASSPARGLLRPIESCVSCFLVCPHGFCHASSPPTASPSPVLRCEPPARGLLRPIEFCVSCFLRCCQRRLPVPFCAARSPRPWPPSTHRILCVLLPRALNSVCLASFNPVLGRWRSAITRVQAAEVRSKIGRGTENLALASREDLPGISRLLAQAVLSGKVRNPGHQKGWIAADWATLWFFALCPSLARQTSKPCHTPRRRVSMLGGFRRCCCWTQQKMQFESETACLASSPRKNLYRKKPPLAPLLAGSAFNAAGRSRRRTQHPVRWPGRSAGSSRHRASEGSWPDRFHSRGTGRHRPLRCPVTRPRSAL